MINRHEFQRIAKQFRGGRISLETFTDKIFADGEKQTQRHAVDGESIRLRLPVRPANSHKGDFGRLLLVGGSATMPGAIALSAIAALRTGAGSVVVMTPDESHPIVASFSPCIMTTGVASADGLFAKDARKEIVRRCDWADVVAIGPGMGRSRAGQKIVQSVYCDVDKPVVLDADALNCLADVKCDLASHPGNRVLTPHPGEFQRIVQEKFERRADMDACAVELARRTQTTILLKGAQTLVTNGDRIYRNATGNAGMATAGAGDVLTGMIASLIGQKMDCFSSAQIGSYLHGRAGDRFAKRSNSASLIATDLIAELPAAMAELAKKEMTVK